MSEIEQNLIEEFPAPYNKIIKLEDILHESGMAMLRVHIREGRRFTVIDLDAATAEKMGEHLLTWSKKNS